MFYRRCNYNHCGCSNMSIYDESELETKCSDINNNGYETDECDCGFDEYTNGLPEYPMLGQSYVPIQKMNKIFRPEVGLNKGTIFPELVSPYLPNQSMEEIEYIKATNKIEEGCNK